ATACLPQLSAEAAVHFMGDDEVVAIEAEATTGIHHFVRRRGEWNRTAEPPRHVEYQQHVLLLQRDVRQRNFGHLAFEDERTAVPEHGRRRHTLEKRI